MGGIIGISMTGIESNCMSYIPNGKYYLVVHVWIQNERGELLLSKLHPFKPYGDY
ncbi:hypothetical protein ABEW03_11385 [Virgibacillus pantothenticus]|uniref:hypothetical protein n=1 Tax=Virgibacillus pantothenticus TaxID=1473 RepID=UPI003D2B3FDC